MDGTRPPDWPVLLCRSRACYAVTYLPITLVAGSGATGRAMRMLSRGRSRCHSRSFLQWPSSYDFGRGNDACKLANVITTSSTTVRCISHPFCNVRLSDVAWESHRMKMSPDLDVRLGQIQCTQ